MAFFEAVWNIATSETTYLNGALFAALLAFAACGEWVAERAGTINISVEAMLLAGALGSAIGYDLSGSTIVGVLFGVLGGVVVALVQANLSHSLVADQFVVGLTLNILMFGLAGFLDRAIDPETTFAAKWEIPLLSDIPLVGEALFGQRWSARRSSASAGRSTCCTRWSRCRGGSSTAPDGAWRCGRPGRTRSRPTCRAST